jgi:hypothetical protein
MHDITTGDAMNLYESDGIVTRFVFGAIGTAAALWFLWATRGETPAAVHPHDV